jgi:hypothetical protein
MALQNGNFVTAAAERDGAAETRYAGSYYLQDPSQHFFKNWLHIIHLAASDETFRFQERGAVSRSSGALED